MPACWDDIPVSLSFVSVSNHEAFLHLWSNQGLHSCFIHPVLCLPPAHPTPLATPVQTGSVCLGQATGALGFVVVLLSEALFNFIFF